MIGFGSLTKRVIRVSKGGETFTLRPGDVAAFSEGTSFRSDGRGLTCFKHPGAVTGFTVEYLEEIAEAAGA